MYYIRALSEWRMSDVLLALNIIDECRMTPLFGHCMRHCQGRHSVLRTIFGYQWPESSTLDTALFKAVAFTMNAKKLSSSMLQLCERRESSLRQHSDQAGAECDSIIFRDTLTHMKINKGYSTYNQLGRHASECGCSCSTRISS